MTEQQPNLPVAVSPVTKNGAPLLSPGLSPLLTEPKANEDGRAVREIARNRALRAEAEALLPVLEAGLRPATADELMAVLMDESICYDMDAKDHTDAGWAAFWGPYQRGLADMPAMCIREAFVAWTRNHLRGDGSEGVRFYPRPGQIYELANEARIRLAMMRHRVRAALEHRLAAPAAPKTPLTDEQRREFRELVGQIGGAPKVMPMRGPAARPMPEPPAAAGPLLNDEAI